MVNLKGMCYVLHLDNQFRKGVDVFSIELIFWGAVHFLDQRTRLTKQNETDKPGRLNTGRYPIT